MTPAARRYMLEFTGAMIGYSAAVVGLRPWVAHQFDDQRALVFAAALSPIIPALFALLAALRFASSWDELQRQKMMEALMIAFLLSGFGFFTYGFLEDEFLPKLGVIWVFPTMIAAMGFAQLCVWLRYR